MQQTFFTLESRGPIEPGQCAFVVARSQIKIRPHRLRIEPTIAPLFQIEEVRVGTCSQFPQAQSMPASQFMHGTGDGFDLGIVLPCIDVSMQVTNISDRVPMPPASPCEAPACDHRLLSMGINEARCECGVFFVGDEITDRHALHRDAMLRQRKKIDPLVGAWGAIMRRGGAAIPFKATWAAFVLPWSVGDNERTQRELDRVLGREDIDTRIADVPEVAGRPHEVTRRELPGFGWDPYGD